MGLMDNVVAQVVEGSGAVGGGFVKLKQIDPAGARAEVGAMLIDGEQIIAAFQAMRDQVLFTNARIITIDVKGLTGSRKSYKSQPYSKIAKFEIQTAGFIELFPDQELWLWDTSGGMTRYDFSDAIDIGPICKMIARYMCK